MKQMYISLPCAECGMSQIFWVETEEELVEKATAAGWKDGLCGLCNNRGRIKENNEQLKTEEKK